MAEGVFDRIIGVTEKETKRKAVETAKEYILGNWSGIPLSMKGQDKNVRCSAEGYVSHVYADRMSSRPLAWSRTGADKMSRLRIYRQNNGDMLELVRYQKKEMKQVAGAEEVIYSASEMLDMEKANRKKLGVLAELPIYSTKRSKAQCEVLTVFLFARISRVRKCVLQMPCLHEQRQKNVRYFLKGQLLRCRKLTIFNFGRMPN